MTRDILCSNLQNTSSSNIVHLSTFGTQFQAFCFAYFCSVNINLLRGANKIRVAGKNLVSRCHVETVPPITIRLQEGPLQSLSGSKTVSLHQTLPLWWHYADLHSVMRATALLPLLLPQPINLSWGVNTQSCMEVSGKSNRLKNLQKSRCVTFATAVFIAMSCMSFLVCCQLAGRYSSCFCCQWPVVPCISARTKRTCRLSLSLTCTVRTSEGGGPRGRGGVFSMN